ncbi:ankyrin repeat and SOCS box protein 16-like [Polyodon spathula]|uniref:ankyrin repeat and SOCS box protein 16-like n=1 Tax=Polyodon spathula TaxID=7913 RepID=UPI001B7DE714|nr:ankyrin repeat and SOCS box protein 16-like [Polyodon spathula]
MSRRDTFVFTSAALRNLSLQQELLDLETERRALARWCAGRRRRFFPEARKIIISRPLPGAEPKYCRDSAFHNALFTGDLDKIICFFNDEATSNMIIETLNDELVWSPEMGFWALTPKLKYTSGLRITSGKGYTACAKLLLHKGADVNASPGGLSALHDACAGGFTDCAQLLLSYGANPNILSKEGRAPMHLCTTPKTYQCAKLLLEFGANVNIPTRDSQVSPLHVAAQHGLEEHLNLYLCRGAHVCSRTREGETALNIACASAEKPAEDRRYYRVVLKLLSGGADVRVAGKKNHTPLHNACSNCSYRIVDLLLQHGAAVNQKNCAGYTPMDCVLQGVKDYLDWRPEGIVLCLLNHGASPVNPKMLKLCSLSPRTMEVILNSYEHIPLCDSWAESVPPELWQEHHIFYSSVVHMTNQPRSLQHLARCAIRGYLDGHCLSTITQLQIPHSLQEYLLLRIEGAIK